MHTKTRPFLVLLLLVSTGQFTHAQTGLTAAHSRTSFTIEASGASSLGTVTIESGADIRFGSDRPNYTIGEGHDILLGRSLGPDEAKLRVALKRPDSLSASELAGAWWLYEYKVDQNFNIEYITISQALAVQADTFTIDDELQAIGTVNNVFTTYAVNASKDLMVSTSSEFAYHTLRILVRLESGGATSQMAGSWTVGSFGIDVSVTPPDLWYDGDTLTATSTGVITFSEGSATWATDGSGSITITYPLDPEDPEEPAATTKLSVTQSRNALAYASSPDPTREGAIVLRHAAAPSIAALAGDWTLLTFELLADAANDPNVTVQYHSDGTSLASRYRYKDGQLHGQPAIENWDQAGLPTLVENYNAGVLTYSLAKLYVDSLPSEITETTNDGETETREHTRYYPGTTKLAERQRYKNNKFDGEPAWETWNEAGRYTSIEYYNAGAITYRFEAAYNGAILSYYKLTSYNGETTTREETTRYHPDGTTISLHSVETLTDEGRYVLSESFYADGTPKERYERLDGKQNGLQQTWNAAGQAKSEITYDRGILRSNASWIYDANGVKLLERIYDYTGGADALTINSWTNTGVRKTSEYYLNNQKQGVQFTYDTNGNPRTEDHYDRGLKEGVHREWSLDPYQLIDEAYYSEDLLHGTRRGSSGYDGREGSYVENYDRGLRHGKWFYIGAGNREEDQTWQYGKLMNMEQRSYHPNGILSYREYSDYTFGDVQYPDFVISEGYDEQGRKSLFTTEKHGKKDGLHQRYQEGILVDEQNYRQGLLHGRSLQYSFDNDGQLVSDINYVNGRTDGEFLTYNPETGLLTERSNYRYGKPHGLQEHFFEEGVTQGEYNDGKKTGVHKRWSRDSPGATIFLIEEATYLDDILHGPYTSYYASAIVKSGQYANGLKTGTWTEYWEPGILRTQEDYVKGSLDGLSLSYTQDGTLYFRLYYKQGVRHGTYETYAGLGIRYLSWETTYDNDVLVGPTIKYHPNGVRSSIYPIVLGRIEGTVSTFSSSGARASTETYVAGIQHGTSTSFHANGIKSGAGSFYDGAPCGTWSRWDDDGEFRGSNTYGPCTGTFEPPPIRWLTGTVTANGEGLAGVSLSGPFSSVKTQGDGSYFIGLPETGTNFEVSLQHNSYPDRTISISLSPESGVQERNFSMDTFDKPNITLGEPSIKGLHFLEDVNLAVNIPITVDWGNEPYHTLEWKHGGTTERIWGSDFVFNPGITANAQSGFGSLVARPASGEETSVPLPEYIVHPQPAWSEKLGTWTAKEPEKPDAPATFFLNSVWPEDGKPLNFGIRKSDLSENQWILWQLVPFIGGEDFGIFDTYFDFKATAYTDGRPGTIKLDANADLRLNLSVPTIPPTPSFATKKEFIGHGTGSLAWGNTLSIRNASLKLHFADDEKVILKPTQILGTFEKGVKLLKLLDFLGPMGPQFSEWLNVLEAELAIGLSVDGAIGLYDNKGDLDILFAETKTSVSLGIALDSYFKDSVDLEANVTGRARVTGLYIDGSAPSIDLDSNIRLVFKIAIKDLISPYSFTLPEETTTSSLSKSELSGGLTFVPASYSEDYTPAIFNAHDIIQTFSTESTFNSESDDTPLVSNVYPNADPSIAYSDTLKALAYIHYDSSRPEGLSTRVYYSVDSGSGFQAPQPIHDQLRSDFNPKLAFLPDGRLLAVWETSQADQIPGDLDDRLSGLEITWSIYDESTDTWSEPALLTDNQHLDHQPQLANSTTGPMLLWHSNETNALIASEENPDAINVAIWNDNQFAASSTIGYTIPVLGSVASAYDGANATIAWIQDIDNDLSTPNDSEVFRASYDGSAWSAPQQLTSDTQLDSNPTIICNKNGSFEYLWLKAGRLVWLEDETTLANEDLFSSLGAEGSSDYSVQCNSNGDIAVLWTELAGTQHDLLYAVYNGQWSHPLNLTNSQPTEKYPSLSLSESKLYATYVTEDPDTQQRDLHTLERELGIDLTIQSLEIEPMENSPGQYEIKASIENLGAFPSSTTQLDFHLGDPNAGGTYLGELSVNLKGGEQSVVTFQTGALAEGIIFARIDPANTVDELDENNNETQSNLHPTNLAASYFTWDRSVSDETSLTLNGTVTNNGSTEQTNVPVEIRDESGTILSTTLASIAAGESAAVTTTINTPAGNEHRFTLSVDPSNTLNEPDRSDNAFPLYLSLNQLKDSDGDGMENAWEQLHFGTLDRDGRGDLDGDNLTDVFEFLTLNDPLDESSKFLLTIESHPTDPERVLIQFPSAAGRIYRIQRTTDFINWTNDSFNLGTGETLSVSTTGSITPNQTSAFRVSVSLK